MSVYDVIVLYMCVLSTSLLNYWLICWYSMYYNAVRSNGLHLISCISWMIQLTVFSVHPIHVDQSDECTQHWGLQEPFTSGPKSCPATEGQTYRSALSLTWQHISSVRCHNVHISQRRQFTRMHVLCRLTEFVLITCKQLFGCWFRNEFW